MSFVLTNHTVAKQPVDSLGILRAKQWVVLADEEHFFEGLHVTHEQIVQPGCRFATREEAEAYVSQQPERSWVF